MDLCLAGDVRRCILACKIQEFLRTIFSVCFYFIHESNWITAILLGNYHINRSALEFQYYHIIDNVVVVIKLVTVVFLMYPPAH